MNNFKTKALFCIPCISFFLLVSWFFAVTLEHLSGHHHFRPFLFGKKETDLKKLMNRENDQMQIKDTFENIFTFVQVSDIHISKFRYTKEIIPQLKDLCRNYFPLINPKVIILTGDLTDAKAEDNLKSEQYLDEWVSYKSLIDYCKKQITAEWLDVAGNHDAFGVPSKHDSKNFYEKYGSSHERFLESNSYEFILKTEFGEYSFNGIDMTPDPGPRRPFNFFGVFNQGAIKPTIQVKENDAKNISIWFGHYPLSVITTPDAARQLVQGSLAYICGHLHTLGGLVPRMYARPVEGHLELEVGDWKENRIYRIMVIDHDIFSFVDVKYGEMPIILITNPKDSRFISPKREAVWRIASSTHIRFFVFDKNELVNVSVSIDDDVLCANARHVKNSLYVCPWRPENYANGIHQIQIYAKDSVGKETSKQMQFSLDGSTPLLDLIPAVIMLTDFCVLAKLMYMGSFLLFVIFPLFLRRVKSRNSNGFISGMLPFLPYKLIVFANQDHLFWPLFCYSCYLAIGPLFIGELVPGSIGLCFVHGIYSNGQWIPGSLTYLFGTFQITFFHLPMMLYLGNRSATTKTRPTSHGATGKARLTVWTVLCHVMLVISLFFHLKITRTIYVCYGTMALLLCPAGTWVIPFGMWMMYRAKTFRNSSLLYSVN